MDVDDCIRGAVSRPYQKMVYDRDITWAVANLPIMDARSAAVESAAPEVSSANLLGDIMEMAGGAHSRILAYIPMLTIMISILSTTAVLDHSIGSAYLTRPINDVSCPSILICCNHMCHVLCSPDMRSLMMRRH